MTILSTTLARLRAAWSRPGVRRTAGSAGWLLLDRLLRLVGGLLVGLWVARYLGPSAFGTYNFALALSLIVASVTTLGLDSILVRELVRAPRQEPELLGTALALRFCGGLAAQLLIVLAALLLRPADSLSLVLTAIIGVGGLLQASTVIDLWFQSQVATRDTVLARNLAFLIATLLRVGLIVSGAPLLAFALVYALEAALGALGVALAYLRRGGRLFGWRLSLAMARRLLADSWPLILGGILVNTYLRIDQVMIGQLLGDRELGIYSAAVRLAEVFPLVPGAIIAATLPAIVAARQTDAALYAERLRRLYALVVAIGYLSALAISLGAGLLVALLLGPGYREAVPQLVVLAWAGVFIGLGVARTSFLTAENYTRLHLATVAIGCAANIGLNIALIPAMGGLGAALASLIAYWLAVHGACFIFPALRPVGYELTRALLYPKFW